MFTSILHALAGTAILVLAIAIDRPVSLGSALGLLLILSAALRYLIARNRVKTT